MEIQKENLDGVEGIRFVVYHDDKAVGRVILYILKNDVHNQPFGFLEYLLIDEKYRGQGLGTKLMEKVIEEAQSRNCYKLIGTSRFANESAHRFYERLGFKKWGHEFRLDLVSVQD